MSLKLEDSRLKEGKKSRLGTSAGTERSGTCGLLGTCWGDTGR